MPENLLFRKADEIVSMNPVLISAFSVEPVLGTAHRYFHVLTVCDFPVFRCWLHRQSFWRKIVFNGYFCGENEWLREQQFLGTNEILTCGCIFRTLISIGELPFAIVQFSKKRRLWLIWATRNLEANFNYFLFIDNMIDFPFPQLLVTILQY